MLEKLDAKTKASFETTLSHFQTLVANDVKDRVLKEFQGIVWDTGYKNGTIKVTMFPDAVEFLQTLSSQNKKIFIYSSGSIPAQKLLLAYVASDKSPGTIDLNPLVLDYFDINSSGIKTSKESYENILVSIKARFGAAETHQVVFFSDNILEVTAGTAAGITSIIVDKPGNKPVPENRFRLISDFASVSF